MSACNLIPIKKTSRLLGHILLLFVASLASSFLLPQEKLYYLIFAWRQHHINFTPFPAASLHTPGHTFLAPVSRMVLSSVWCPLLVVWLPFNFSLHGVAYDDDEDTHIEDRRMECKERVGGSGSSVREGVGVRVGGVGVRVGGVGRVGGIRVGGAGGGPLTMIVVTR